MAMKPSQLFFLLLLGTAILLCLAPASDAACQATQLVPCTSAIIGNAMPTTECCNKLKEQQPCLCQYARDPNLQRYVNSPNGKKMLAECKVPVPTC